MKTIKERFWSKVNNTNNPDECWEWNAAIRRTGYGCIKLNKKLIDAHRLSYILHYGEINNSKLYVCHKCDNRKCVNPKHLFLGTNKDNMKDCYDKGRVIPPTNNKFKIGNIPWNKGLKLSNN